MKKILRVLSAVSLFAFLLVPVVVSAAVIVPNATPSGIPTYFGSCASQSGTPAVACLVGNVVSILLAVIFFIAVVFLIIGGFRYVISQGNEEGVEKAKGTITNSIIGIVVVLLAWIIIRVIVGLLETAPT